MDVIARLKAFRQAAYENLCRAHDAAFELTDAVLLTRNAYSLADLSLSPVFRRKWSSINVGSTRLQTPTQQIDAIVHRADAKRCASINWRRSHRLAT